MATGTVERTSPAVFTASETFDVGLDTDSPVAKNTFDQAPFEFNGTLKLPSFKYLKTERPDVTAVPE